MTFLTPIKGIYEVHSWTRCVPVCKFRQNYRPSCCRNVEDAFGHICNVSAVDAVFRLTHITALVMLELLILLEIPVTIYTQNHQLIYDLIGESRASLGMQKQLTNDLAVRYDNGKIRTVFGLAEMVQITLIVPGNISAGVGAGLIAAWLLTKLNTKEAQVVKLEIDKVPVKLDEDEIKKALLERMKTTNHIRNASP